MQYLVQYSPFVYLQQPREDFLCYVTDYCVTQTLIIEQQLCNKQFSRLVDGNFRILDRLQEFINDPINSKSSTEFKMTMGTSTISETMELFLPDTAESTWKCNIIVSGFCGEMIFREIT